METIRTYNTVKKFIHKGYGKYSNKQITQNTPMKKIRLYFNAIFPIKLLLSDSGKNSLKMKSDSISNSKIKYFKISHNSETAVN